MWKAISLFDSEMMEEEQIRKRDASLAHKQTWRDQLEEQCKFRKTQAKVAKDRDQEYARINKDQVDKWRQDEASKLARKTEKLTQQKNVQRQQRLDKIRQRQEGEVREQEKAHKHTELQAKQQEEKEEGQRQKLAQLREDMLRTQVENTERLEMKKQKREEERERDAELQRVYREHLEVEDERRTQRKRDAEERVKRVMDRMGKNAQRHSEFGNGDTPETERADAELDLNFRPSPRRTRGPPTVSYEERKAKELADKERRTAESQKERFRVLRRQMAEKEASRQAQVEERARQGREMVARTLELDRREDEKQARRIAANMEHRRLLEAQIEERKQKEQGRDESRTELLMNKKLMEKIQTLGTTSSRIAKDIIIDQNSAVDAPMGSGSGRLTPLGSF